MKCDTYLQVALDFTVLEDAVSLASKLPDEPWIILEAGTPLIKSEGMRSVSILKSMAGSRLVAADLKTMDTGSLEASMAFRSGADIVSVLALAPDETIRGAVEEASRRGGLVMADLIGAEDPVGHVSRLESLGVDIILYHVGIDVQTGKGVTASSRADLVRSLKKTISNSLMAVAGGIKPGEAGELKEAGADIIIIGSAITGSNDPLREVDKFKTLVQPVCG